MFYLTKDQCFMCNAWEYRWETRVCVRKCTQLAWRLVLTVIELRTYTIISVRSLHWQLDLVRPNQQIRYF